MSIVIRGHTPMKTRTKQPKQGHFRTKAQCDYLICQGCGKVGVDWAMPQHEKLKHDGEKQVWEPTDWRPEPAPPHMNQTDLVLYIAKKTGVPRRLVKPILLALYGEIKHYVARGHRVKLRDLGAFYLVEHGRSGNPEKIGRKKPKSSTLKTMRFCFLAETRAKVRKLSV